MVAYWQECFKLHLLCMLYLAKGSNVGGKKNSSLLTWSILLQWNLLEKDGQAYAFKLEQEEDLCSLKAARA